MPIKTKKNLRNRHQVSVDTVVCSHLYSLAKNFEAAILAIFPDKQQETATRELLAYALAREMNKALASTHLYCATDAAQLLKTAEWKAENFTVMRARADGSYFGSARKRA